MLNTDITFDLVEKATRPKNGVLDNTLTIDKGIITSAATFEGVTTYGVNISGGINSIIGVHSIGIRDILQVGEVVFVLSTYDGGRAIVGTATSPAWATYTPTWGALVGSVTVGNATVMAAYQQIGKTLDVRFDIILGSTTSVAGSQFWTLSLPPGKVAKTSGGRQLVVAEAEDTAVLGYPPANAYINPGATVMTINYQATVPFSWGNGDRWWGMARIEID